MLPPHLLPGLLLGHVEDVGAAEAPLQPRLEPLVLRGSAAGGRHRAALLAGAPLGAVEVDVVVPVQVPRVRHAAAQERRLHGEHGEHGASEHPLFPRHNS